MIGRLRGEIIAKQPPQLLVECQGVGYEVEAPMSTFYELPEVGQSVTLLTHLLIRDDAHVLYGFRNAHDRALFRALLRVTGVGAKMALAILSGMDAERFRQCVEQEDITMLSRVPGIGKKTAQRLVVEMKDRIAELGAGLASTSTGGPLSSSIVPAPAVAAADDPLSDAIGALIALGYKPAEASRMARAAADGASTSEEIIRAALRSISPS